MAAPVQLVGADGKPLFSSARTAADSIPLPTAPDVLATLMVNSGGELSTVRSPGGLSDANSLASALGVGSFLLGGSTWDRQRGNTEGTVIASAAYTATQNSATQTNYNARGVKIFISATAASATPSVVFTLTARDPIDTATWVTLLTSAAITGISETVLTLYPGITVAANVSVSDVLPRTWRITATHGDADSITYSVGYAYIL